MTKEPDKCIQWTGIIDGKLFFFLEDINYELRIFGVVGERRTGVLDILINERYRYVPPGSWIKKSGKNIIVSADEFVAT